MGRSYSKRTGIAAQKIDNCSKQVTSKKEVKILILGALESGKSTLMKQLKILFQKDWFDKQRNCYESVVYNNIGHYMCTLLKAMKDLKIPFENESNVRYGQVLCELTLTLEDITLKGEEKKILEALWNDAGVKECFNRSSEYQIGDSLAYYMDNLDRICGNDYIPTEQDVLRSRVKTTGIIEDKFEYKGFRFAVVDVGGARSERKKWIHCFQDVTAVIFCVAMSAYDQRLVEDEETNRMQESLRLFESICKNKFFSKVMIVLFLNKTDVFKEKIKKSPLTICFPEYTGENQYEPAREFIRNKFEERIKRDEEVFVHFTTATDTENVRSVFESVVDIIIKNSITATVCT